MPNFYPEQPIYRNFETLDFEDVPTMLDAAAFLSLGKDKLVILPTSTKQTFCQKPESKSELAKAFSTMNQCASVTQIICLRDSTSGEFWGVVLEYSGFGPFPGWSSFAKSLFDNERLIYFDGEYATYRMFNRTRAADQRRVLIMRDGRILNLGRDTIPERKIEILLDGDVLECALIDLSGRLYSARTRVHQLSTIDRILYTEVTLIPSGRVLDLHLTSVEGRRLEFSTFLLKSGLYVNREPVDVFENMEVVEIVDDPRDRRRIYVRTEDGSICILTIGTDGIVAVDQLGSPMRRVSQFVPSQFARGCGALHGLLTDTWQNQRLPIIRSLFENNRAVSRSDEFQIV